MQKTGKRFLAVLLAALIFLTALPMAALAETSDKIPLTVIINSQTKTYGDPDPEFTYSVEGLLADDEISVELTRAPGNNVGTYEITAQVTADGKYEVECRNALLTIEKKRLTVIANPIQKVFGEEDPELTYRMEGLVDEDDIPVSLTRAPGDAAGTYDITIEIDAGDNYMVTLVGAVFTIEKKTVYLVADPKAKVFGEEDPALTYTVSGLLGDDTLGCTLKREPGENAGQYAILIDSLTVSDNYAVDYTGAFLTIDKRTVSVVADPKSKTYAEEDPELTYTVTGLLGDDSLTGALERRSGEAAGEYSIMLGSLNHDNYAISYTGATFTILPKDISVTADAQEKTYSEADPALTYTVTGLVGDDTLSGSLAREPGENAGTYAIGLGTLGNPNYAISYTGAPFTINRKQMTVTAREIYKREDDPDPELTWKVDGLVEGDPLTVNLTRAEGIDVGDYLITAEIDAGNNYDVTYIPATFHILTKICPLCGEVHDHHTFTGFVITFVHDLLYVIKRINFHMFETN